MKKPILPLKSIAVLAFFTASFVYSQDYKGLVNKHIKKDVSAMQVQQDNLKDFEIDTVDPSESLNGTLLTLQQSFMNKPVYSKTGKALVRNGEIIYMYTDFLKNTTTTSAGSLSLSPEMAFDKAFTDLQLTGQKSDFVLSKMKTEKNVPSTQRLVRYEEVYYPVDNALVLAYHMVFEDSKTSNAWNLIIDAQNGNMLLKDNLLLSCSFDHSIFAHDDKHPHVVKNINYNNDSTNKLTVNAQAPNSASYNVFALPVESPIHGGRTLLTNPYVVASSPEGWHNTVTNPPYTITRGNNVFAYEDSADSNSPGYSPDGGANRVFDYPYSLNSPSISNRDASITNLFYINNMMHDVMYKFGFKEVNKNFQSNNFGLGGLGNDHVLAEGEDGGGLNNANFASMSDGTNGRMQMYLWEGNSQLLFFNSPADMVPLNYTAITAEFGPELNATGVTANIGTSNPIDACTTLTAGSLTGKIALVQRGNCSFVIKVKNAQNAGAVGVIIDQAQTSGPIGGMAGIDATITIPSILIQYDPGQNIRTRLAAGTTINATMKNDPNLNIQRDGSFDNGIVAHEYGHGISNRLTGTGSGCLSTLLDNEQMGEGWSDFFAVMLTNRPGDNASIPRGIGNYAIFEPIDGTGIRPAPYSPDFGVNNFTYGSTNTMASNGSPIVHSIGFVWNTMLWDLHWKYVEKYGYNSNVMADPNSGSARVFQMVTDGLKLQPCLPTFVDGRNAILAADQAATGGADRCLIWKAFAKRGLGVNASAGSKTNITDQVEDFTFPPECATISTEDIDAVKNAIKLYPNPAKNEFSIRFPETIIGKVKVSIFDVSGKLVSEESITPANETKVNTTNLENGMYVVKAQGLGVNYTSQLIIKK